MLRWCVKKSHGWQINRCHTNKVHKSLKQKYKKKKNRNKRSEWNRVVGLAATAAAADGFQTFNIPPCVCLCVCVFYHFVYCICRNHSSVVQMLCNFAIGCAFTFFIENSTWLLPFQVLLSKCRFAIMIFCLPECAPVVCSDRQAEQQGCFLAMQCNVLSTRTNEKKKSKYNFPSRKCECTWILVLMNFSLLNCFHSAEIDQSKSVPFAHTRKNLVENRL